MSVIDLLLSYSFLSVEFYKKMRSDSFLIWRATPCAEEEHIKIQYLVKIYTPLNPITGYR
jgi:hypothetical protein